MSDIYKKSESGSFENENIEINEEFNFMPGDIKILWLDSERSLHWENELDKFENSNQKSKSFVIKKQKIE